MKTCEVCKEEQHKYKCPKCRLKYCSVGCFKKHKETGCVPPVQEEPPPPKPYKPQPKKVTEEGELSESENDDTEDQVPKELLDKLDTCQELRDMLQNPHLQSMLLQLNSSSSPHTAMEEAMHEPIFTDFADVCLEIVEPKACPRLLEPERYQNNVQSL